MRRVELIGNLGADAELKTLNNGSVANFRIAAKTGRKDDESEWFSCSLFGKRGEALLEYLKKGTQVFVRGDFKVRKYQKDGQDRYSLDVTCEEVELVGGKKEESRDEASKW